MLPRSLVKTVRAIPLLVLALWLAACDKAEAPAKTWRDVCVDLDHDGYGFECSDGDDCDDHDPTLHTDCNACAGTSATTGCACPSAGATESCVAGRSVTEAGALACQIGTRTCRDGAWTACEGLSVVEVPASSVHAYRAIIDPDAGSRQCDPCHPDCYRVDDPLDETDASLGTNVISSGGGGVTLYSAIPPDAGVAYDAGSSDACVPGVAPDSDCDGIPDVFDQYPTRPPFASTHQTVFLDLDPGQSKDSDIDIRFTLNTADIYLYLDMTGSMDGERTNLLNSFTTGNYLPDGGVGLQCADRNQNGSVADEEPLKDQGILGNLACVVRDSWLGAGWHRDLPFGELDTSGFAYGPDDFELFKNEVDLTDNVAALNAALARFRTRGGINRPEGGIMGLHAIATGDEFYMGWDRPGIPRRSTCPAGHFGYPCFRNEAVPIVIWITDAPLTNGPPTAENTLGPEQNFFTYPSVVNQPMTWGVSNTRINTGTSSAYFPVASSNGSYGTALDVGSINDSFRTFMGDSTGLAGDFTSAMVGPCLGGNVRTKTAPVVWDVTQQAAPNAVFKFRVDTAEPLTITSRGSHVKSSVVIVDAARNTTTGATATATNGNSSAASALNLGTINPLTATTMVSGTTASGTAIYTRDNFGTCLAQNTGSGDKVAAGVVKFNLAADLPNGLRITPDGNYAMASALFAGPPGTPTDTSLSSVYPNVLDSYSVGDMVGRYVRLTAGTTNNAAITSDYASSMFSSVAGCESVGANGPDAVVDFTLSAPTRVRIEGTGANTTLTAGFDHAIALVRRASVAHAPVTNNYTDATAQVIDLSEVPSDQTGGSEYTGTLGGTPATYFQSELGPFTGFGGSTACTNAAAAATTSSQAVFVMDVTSGTAGSYDFETAGSSISTWLSLHRTAADTQVNVAAASPAPLNSGVIQDLGSLGPRSLFVQAATLEGHGTNAADFYTRTNFGCTTSPTLAGGGDAVYTFTVDTTRTVRVSTAGGTTSNLATNAGTPGFNSHLGVFAGSISAVTRVAGGCDDQSGNGYTAADFVASPGITYYVVVKYLSTTSTALTGATALYGLWVRDINFSSNFVACNYGSQLNYPTTSRAARVTATLSAGRYYVVVKGVTAGAAYKLNVRRTPTGTPPVLACNRNGVANLRSYIEQDLPAGKYSVILRGTNSSDTGAYNLILRDTGTAAVAMGCSYDGNTGLPASLVTGALPATRNGTPIDYYAVMRGNTATGSYSMYLENAGLKPTQCAWDNLITNHYDPTNGNSLRLQFDLNNGEWTGTLQPGDYYAIVKGEDTTDVASNTEDDDYGPYQLSIGDQANHTGVADLGQKTWLGPSGDGRGGIREALVNRSIRVVTVDSTRGPDDDPAWTNDPYYSNQQLETVARETNATRNDGSPLFFNINSNGTGLGSAIVQGVSELAGALAMNVSARLVQDPDRPSPQQFGFTVEAIDMPGDLCAAPIDSDGDAAHLPDTHVGCTPGATPKFRVSFTNPAAPNYVRPNPSDPQGGYHMRVELIGDDQYVVDQVPVYIIPANVIPDPGEPLYAASGEYVQDTSASSCSGTEAPLWATLAWEDSLPFQTSIAWDICTAASQAGLDTCTYRRLATVSSGSACTTSAECSNGYCAASGYCEYVAGPSCTRASDCGLGGTCVSGQCAWTTNPIDLKPALGGGAQGEPFLRTRLTMNANPSRTQAPTVQTWGVKYTCTPQE